MGRIDALGVGRAVLALGGGRERKGEAIDHGVGVELLRKPGEAVDRGEPVLRLYHRDGRGLDTARRLLEDGLSIMDTAPAPGEADSGPRELSAPALGGRRITAAAAPCSSRRGCRERRG